MALIAGTDQVSTLPPLPSSNPTEMPASTSTIELYFDQCKCSHKENEHHKVYMAPNKEEHVGDVLRRTYEFECHDHAPKVLKAELDETDGTDKVCDSARVRELKAARQEVKDHNILEPGKDAKLEKVKDIETKIEWFSELHKEYLFETYKRYQDRWGADDPLFEMPVDVRDLSLSPSKWDKFRQ